MKSNKFLIHWSLLTLAFFTAGYIGGYIAGLITASFFGLTVTDDGTHLAQTIIYCVFGSVLVATVSSAQFNILKSNGFKISKWWIPAGISGIVISELIIGIVLWKMGINRSGFGLFQGGPQLPESLIFSFSGLFMILITNSLRLSS